MILIIFKKKIGAHGPFWAQKYGSAVRIFLNFAQLKGPIGR